MNKNKFKRGDIRDDGLVFKGYDNRTGKMKELWVTAEKLNEIRKRSALQEAKRRENPEYRKAASDAKKEKSKDVEYMKTVNRRRRSFYAANREKIIARVTEYSNRPEVKARKKEYMKKYTPKYEAKKKKTDPIWRMKKLIRNRLNCALRHQSAKKQTVFKEYIGCTRSELKSHIEKQFKKGMTWSNQGRVWHLDHIRPISSFDLEKESEQLKVNHYTNLQPLLCADNLSKSDKWDGQDTFAHLL